MVMAGTEDTDSKIVSEFCRLLIKSKQLFNGLRELLPQGHTQWQPYFGKTFDIYTKLWKFQQQHRMILDTKYGLQRWQIGEIASKIGQLYYQYYLRTSDTNYLTEAFAFYAAIRGRAYYSKAAKEDRSDIMVKMLRYYARFIVVSLLLKKTKLVQELVSELNQHIGDYTSTYEPEDSLEWALVLNEIKSFVRADSLVNLVRADSNTTTPLHRLSPSSTPPFEKTSMMNMTLHEVIIAGSKESQVKFSEYTMDMFRMLQTLEREIQDDLNHVFDASPGPGRLSLEKFISNCKSPKKQINNERPCKRENPHKYVLFQPTVQQLLIFLATGFNELPPNGALLLYISADGCTHHPRRHECGCDMGGKVMNCKREQGDHSSRRRTGARKEISSLYIGDLYPVTRKPCFFIIESESSFVFQKFQKYFGQPLVILMSPQDFPQGFQDQHQSGSLFTLFLHSPLTAFCYICKISDIPSNHWEEGQNYIRKFFTEASKVFTKSRVDISYIQFFGDDFLRLLILRFIFCCVVLYLHRGFKGRQFRPRSQPPLPDVDLLENQALQQHVIELAAHLEVQGHFSDSHKLD